MERRDKVKGSPVPMTRVLTGRGVPQITPIVVSP
jgi:hypothetical protein